MPGGMPGGRLSGSSSGRSKGFSSGLLGGGGGRSRTGLSGVAQAPAFNRIKDLIFMCLPCIFDCLSIFPNRSRGKLIPSATRTSGAPLRTSAGDRQETASRRNPPRHGRARRRARLRAGIIHPVHRPLPANIASGKHNCLRLRCGRVSNRRSGTNPAVTVADCCAVKFSAWVGNVSSVLEVAEAGLNEGSHLGNPYE